MLGTKRTKKWEISLKKFPSLSLAFKRFVDEIVFVGGSTRIPLIERVIEEKFWKKHNKSINPDEAVSVGAAIQASVLTGKSSREVFLFFLKWEGFLFYWRSREVFLFFLKWEAFLFYWRSREEFLFFLREKIRWFFRNRNHYFPMKLLCLRRCFSNSYLRFERYQCLSFCCTETFIKVNDYLSS